MSITIHLSNQIEEKLKSITTQNGLDLEVYLEQLITENVEKRLSKEDDLLLKINQGISIEKWQRFYVLKEKKENQVLTEIEHQEIISIYSEIENIHAQRMLYLVELANLRGTDLRSLMTQLGIKTPINE
jgi:hypothetical protein